MAATIAQLGASAAPVLEVSGITKYFAARKRLLGGKRATVYAVDGVSLSIAAGAIFASLVGMTALAVSASAHDAPPSVRPPCRDHNRRNRRHC